MLTKGDDYPIHQTPEPIAYAGSDRNFYDRYFFNAYSPDGETFVAVAFGVYPALNVADAHVSILKAGRQRCIHASRVLGMERMELSVGPIRIEVIEPLRTLRVVLEPTDGLACDLTFEGRAFPIEEPRFTRRKGPRLFMDYTRLTQNARVAGTVAADGERIACAGWLGTRDRSWGIRPVGLADPQPTPGGSVFGFFWQWTPLNFDDRSVFFHLNADPDGSAWNTRAVILKDGEGAGAGQHVDSANLATTLAPGLRHATKGVLTVGEAMVELTPKSTFLMRGIGYGGEWRHGALRGQLDVAREDIDVAGADMTKLENLHIQAISTAVLKVPGEPDRHGVGVFEQLILGPYAPLGLS